jgi:hypothetical protein
MADKFIPDSDSEFSTMARGFATVIKRDPARFKLSAEDAALIDRAAAEFDAAWKAVTNKGLRSGVGVMAKDRLRGEAERVIRRYGKLMRADETISASDKLAVGIKERPAKLKPRKCPQTRPLLIFRGANDATSVSGPVHVLAFREEPHLDLMRQEMAPLAYRAKPAGAARVELYVELVDEGEPIPRHPGELSGGRPWYLRSFTRTPMEVEVPVASVSAVDDGGVLGVLGGCEGRARAVLQDVRGAGGRVVELAGVAARAGASAAAAAADRHHLGAAGAAGAGCGSPGRACAGGQAAGAEGGLGPFAAAFGAAVWGGAEVVAAFHAGEWTVPASSPAKVMQRWRDPPNQ